MTEKEKMLAGEYYLAIDPELVRELNETKDIIQQYNNLRHSDTQGRFEILKNLIGNMADDNALIIQPFFCDYGKHIRLGKRFFANFNFTVLD